MSIARVLDLETTGLPDEGGRICEIAWYDVSMDAAPYPILGGHSALINPCMEMPPEIRAVHHIAPSSLIGCPVPGWAIDAAGEGLGPGDVLVAHMAEFEAAFIPAPPGVSWCCTWKISLRAWPLLESHSNQALRYALQIDDKPGYDAGLSMPPHRAAPDAYTTAFLFREMLALRPLARLIEISSEPGFLYWIGGQKHKGKTFKEVALIDAEYLDWIAYKSDMSAENKFTAKHWLERLKEKATAV